MKRHSLNAFSLVFGIVLILLAAWTAFAPRGRLFDTQQWQWLLPTAVILVGAALMSPLFTTTKRNKTPKNTDGHEPAEATDTPPDHP